VEEPGLTSQRPRVKDGLPQAISKAKTRRMANSDGCKPKLFLAVCVAIAQRHIQRVT
jgi:hypothetical protein